MADEIREAASSLTDKEAQDILAMLEKQEGIGLKEKEQGMVMLTARDPFGFDFYVGEIFVTQAEAIYEGMRGYGMVLGDKPGQAMVLAVYDALTGAGEEELTGFIRNGMNDAILRNALEKDEQNMMAASTKVNFGLMSEG